MLKLKKLEFLLVNCGHNPYWCVALGILSVNMPENCSADSYLTAEVHRFSSGFRMHMHNPWWVSVIRCIFLALCANKVIRLINQSSVVQSLILSTPWTIKIQIQKINSDQICISLDICCHGKKRSTVFVGYKVQHTIIEVFLRILK